MKQDQIAGETENSALLEETRFTLSQVARKAGVNSSTVWRWTLKGVRGTKLATFSIGAKRYVLASELERFIWACTSAANGGQQPPASRTNRQRDAAQAAANRGLAKHGI